MKDMTEFHDVLHFLNEHPVPDGAHVHMNQGGAGDVEASLFFWNTEDARAYVSVFEEIEYREGIESIYSTIPSSTGRRITVNLHLMAPAQPAAPSYQKWADLLGPDPFGADDDDED